MLSVLLETMHEDCNQISKKPYIEQKDSNDRPDAEVAQDFWNGFMQREKSIFVDLFYGQLKSRVCCTLCNNVSITFDPYNVLSVPIPSQPTQRKPLTVNYYPQSISQPVFQFTFDLDTQTAKGVDLIQKL